MKILVVGYACNPFGSSEPGVGWTAVCRIALRHEVCVLTDIHNREGWARVAKEGTIPTNVRVYFLRDRRACSANRFIAQHRSANPRLYQLITKKSQSPLPGNDLKASQNQGSGLVTSTLWDGSVSTPWTPRCSKPPVAVTTV